MKSNLLGFIPDENLLEILQIDDDIGQENIFTYLILEEKNIPLQRYSCDKGRVNKYGNLLLECCKRCGLLTNEIKHARMYN
jgi:hypothetical protein